MKKEITYIERMVIQSGIQVGKSNRSIATCLGRTHSVINYEIKQNSGTRERYTAKTAECLFKERRNKKRKRKLEMECNKDLHDYVVIRIRDGIAPDVIAGRLSTHERQLVPGKTISHEAIYQYIYHGRGRFEYLYPFLKKAGRKRTKQRSGVYKKCSIPSKISIHERTEEINEKVQVGHWESDTIVGKMKGSTYALSVQYERVCKITKIHRVVNKTADKTHEAIKKTIEQFPLHLVKSFTFDNGGESANHVELRKQFGIQTFHCDAYASWQKGGVENTNGLIRHYIPKGSDIAMFSDSYIQWVEDTLNNTPRKSLNYLTPYEALNLWVD